MKSTERTRISLPEFCRQRGIARETAIGWIEHGELLAIDLRSATAKRPRFYLRVEDIAAFEEKRRVGVTPATQTARQRRRSPATIPDYFKD